jgi:hypothetical protein
LDTAYTEAFNTLHDAANDVPMVMNDSNCLFSIYHCADKYLAEFNQATSSESVWRALSSRPGYSIERRVVGANQKRIEYKLDIDIDSTYSELGLFEQLSVGEGLTFLYPVFALYCFVCC